MQPTPRTYNFSQFFAGGTNSLLATIRNWNYKLSYDSAGSPSVYQLFEYDNSEIPGGEDDGTVVDMFDDAVNRLNVDAAAILTTLRPELQA